MKIAVLSDIHDNIWSLEKVLYELVARYAAQSGKTLFANPGEVMGKSDRCTFGIYDTKSEKFGIIKIKQPL